MAHPFDAFRQSKVEHARVPQITKGYAAGGAVHSDEAEDKRMIKGMVKKSALRADGGAVKARQDRVPRASGGGVFGRKGGKKGKSNKTIVNVINHGQGAPVPGLGAAPGIPGAPGLPAGPVPMPPPRPPMAGPPGLPPAIPGGAGLPGLPPRSQGGRAYKSGGAVKPGAAWNEGLKEGTQVSHRNSKAVEKENLGRGKPVTYRKGGRVKRAEGGEADKTKNPGRPSLTDLAYRAAADIGNPAQMVLRDANMARRINQSASQSRGVEGKDYKKGGRIRRAEGGNADTETVRVKAKTTGGNRSGPAGVGNYIRAGFNASDTEAKRGFGTRAYLSDETMNNFGMADREKQYKTGGAINAPGPGKAMSPKFEGGARGGMARMAKAKRARRDYAKPLPGHG